MNNISLLSDALAEWGTNIAKSVLPKVSIPQSSPIGRMMSGFLGIDLSRYSIYNELGFLIEPTIRTYIHPMITRYLGAIPDEEIPAMAMMYADLLRDQAAAKGYVDVFGIQIGESSFVRLKEILTQKYGSYERVEDEIRGAVRDNGDLERPGKDAHVRGSRTMGISEDGRHEPSDGGGLAREAGAGHVE